MRAVGEPTDLELLEQWRAGDRTAGDRLFQRHFRAILRFFRNKVEPSALEDLVQQTFMACVEGRERFRQESKFTTYLFGTAYNLLRDHYRRAKKKPDAVDITEQSAVDLGAGPSTVMGRRRAHKVLLEALRRIPVQSQIVLELYYWEEMSASQTAAVLQIPEGTVRGRVRRAKELLRREIAKLDDNAAELETIEGGLDNWAASLREMLEDEAADAANGDPDDEPA